jgi:hypothetical protein
VETRRGASGALLLGAAEALRDAINYPVPPASLPAYERLTSQLSDALGQSDFVNSVRHGRSMSLRVANELAVSDDDSSAAMGGPTPVERMHSTASRQRP